MSDRIDLETAVTDARAAYLVLDHFVDVVTDAARQKDRTVTITIDADVFTMLSQARRGAASAIEALTQAFYAAEHADA